MLVLGEKERENGTVSVRNRKKGDIGSMSVDELVAKLTKEIDEKSSDMYPRTGVLTSEQCVFASRLLLEYKTETCRTVKRFARFLHVLKKNYY